MYTLKCKHFLETIFNVKYFTFENILQQNKKVDKITQCINPEQKLRLQIYSLKCINKIQFVPYQLRQALEWKEITWILGKPTIEVRVFPQSQLIWMEQNDYSSE